MAEVKTLCGDEWDVQREGGKRRAPCRIRTDDPRFTRAVLWPTELRRRARQGWRRDGAR